MATASTAGIPEAVPGVPAVSAVTKPAEWLGPEPGGLPPCNIEAMVVNIYVVGVDRFSEHMRDDDTCPVNVLYVCHEHREIFSADGCEVEWVRGKLHYLYQFCNSPLIQGLLLLLCIIALCADCFPLQV